MMLLGRRSECEVLEGLLDGARVGRSGALVVRGEPGVGKTALLEHAVESASDFGVVRAVGVQSEMELASAGLHQLCTPMLDRLDRLPGRQRDALAIIFGQGTGAVPDRFLVGLSVLSLLSEVAEERPLLCVVDDAQWLDRASAQAFAFVARRLFGESVVMLIAAREPSDEFQGLPELVIQGLRPSEARELLASVIRWPLDERVREQIVAETRGNPLALLELPQGLTPAELAGGFGLLGAPSLSDRIEESFRHRLETLSERTQQLLLVAAAEPAGDPALLWRAAERLGVASTALEPAESAGLLEVGARVRFHHPLVRSAVYYAASPEGRRKVHRALAEVTNAEVDPDRRAWHLAEATTGADENVAAELERAAGWAQARGGLAAAGAFLERAVALTPEPAGRSQRALAAAQTKYEAGSFDDALALLATADTGVVDDLQCARGHLLRAQIAFASRRGSDAPPLLLRAARELEEVDVDLARATYLEALAAALFAGRLARGAGVAEVSEAALACPPPPHPPGPHDLLLHGVAIRFTEGYAAGAPIVREALSAFRRETVVSPQDASWFRLAWWATSDFWDDETWYVLSTREVERARETGALTAMLFALSARTALLATSGEVTAAASLLDEARAVTEATGSRPLPYSALWLAALRGREAELSELTETMVSEAEAQGEGYALDYTEFASAVLYNGLGRYDAALAAIRHVGESTYDMGSPTRAVAELIEAAARCGEQQLARRALERLAETAHASGTEWSLGVEARSRALLSEGEAAESLYREAIERLERTRVRVELARAHLLYGEWLRRERRRVEAREQLRHAYEMFTMMGTDAFAERAERELSATGERARKLTVETRGELTPQEAQIAQLARDGLSNPDIGARLFISPRTVEYHLHKVFAKLSIGSRNELSHALPSAPSVAPA